MAILNTSISRAHRESEETAPATKFRKKSTLTLYSQSQKSKPSSKLFTIMKGRKAFVEMLAFTTSVVYDLVNETFTISRVHRESEEATVPATKFRETLRLYSQLQKSKGTCIKLICQYEGTKGFFKSS